MVVVRILFKMVMMMVREVRKNEFEADFDDNNSDDEADIGFDIDMPDEINNSRNQNCDADPGVV